MDLNITERNVLKALNHFKGKWVSTEDIYKFCITNRCKVNRSNIARAIKFLLSNNLIYEPNSQGKVKLNQAGIDVYDGFSHK
ncbi:MAG: hypothetical protein PUE01_09470 [Clostridiaceae bacterium]|nr:hypothetical protein [Clostridiaceae bacterium]